MQVIIAAGESFDICFSASWALNYLEYAHQGAFYDITDLVEADTALKNAINPLYIQGAKIDGRMYALPNNKDLTARNTWTFNRRLLDKYNLDVSEIADLRGIESLKALEPYLKVIAENEPDVHAFTPGGNENLLLYDFIIGNKTAPIVLPIGTGSETFVNLYEYQPFIDHMHIVRDYYEKGYIKADYDPDNTDLTQTGKYFVGMRQAWPLEVVDPLWSRGEKDPVKSVWANNGRVTTDSALGALLAVSVTSENPEKSYEFLSLLNTDAYTRNMVDSGIEGVHYEMIDGKQKDLEAGKDRYNMPSFSLGNLFPLHVYTDEPENKWELLNELNKGGAPSPAFGFVVDRTPIETELAIISNVYEEFRNFTITGKIDLDEYLPRINKKFKDAGIDTVIAEIQKQYDAWKAAN